MKRMCRSLRHRGLNDEGFFFDKNLALGHRALKIGNIPVAHQPLSNEDGTIWITFDGEIYNAKRLKEQLEKKYMFNTNSSAEFVVHAYEEYGFKCLSKFNGMFAFCLWDSKDKRLFSARDRLGMRPLHYYTSQGHVILASEIKGILADPSVPRKPNKRLIYEYLVKGGISRVGDTFFKGIKELMPAHYMIIDKSGIKIQKYWQPIQHLKSNPTMDDYWYTSKFRQLLRDSISIRMPANLPVGTFLSGGLDSTAIAFFVEDVLRSRHSSKIKSTKLQKLFSAIYEEPTEQGDEIRYIKEAAHNLKTEVNYIFPSVAGEWNNIERFIFYIEEPMAIFNYYVYWRLFQSSKQKVKIIFSGQGADETLGGMTTHAIIYFTELWKTKKIGKLLNELIRSSDWLLPLMADLILTPMHLYRNPESTAKTFLAPDFVAAYSQDENRKKYFSLQNHLLNDITLHEHLRVDDRASSAFSIECRHPFLDHRIVELAFSLPATQKIRNGWTKYVMRNAVKRFIPEAIKRKRKKTGTPIPQRRWMKELQQSIRKLFESKKFREREYFNQPAVLDMFNSYCERKLSRIECYFYGNMIWRILNLELWLETFFDSKRKNKLNASEKEET